MEHMAHEETRNEEVERLMEGRDTRWYRGCLLRLTLCCLLALITSATNGYDGSMMNGLQTLDQWAVYFNHPQGGTLGLFNAIQSIGGLLALPFAALISDRLGRRNAIMIGSTIMLISTAIQTAAQNVAMFIVARGFIGFGLAIAGAAAPLLITELCFPSHRAPLTSLYNSSWYLGSIIAAWTTYGTFRINSTWSWRIPSLLQGLPSLVQFFLIYTIPESPRWLVDHGYDDRAIAFFTKYHCQGNSEDPLIDFEYQEIKAALALEKTVKNSSTWKPLFATRGNLKRMRIIIAIAFFSQWSGNGVVSYYLSIVLTGIGIKSVATQNLINGLLQIYNWATAITGALLVDKAGRRTLFLISTGGMTVTYAIWTACYATYVKSADAVTAGTRETPNNPAGYMVIVMIFLYYGAYNLAMSPLLVSYTVEILPFSIRAKGLVIMNLAVNISLIFNQYVNPIALKALGWKYYIVYCVWLGFEFCFLYRYLIETKDGKSLEEIAALFDGVEASQAIQAQGAEAALGGHNTAGSDGQDQFGIDEKFAEKGENVHVETRHELRA